MTEKASVARCPLGGGSAEGIRGRKASIKFRGQTGDKAVNILYYETI